MTQPEVRVMWMLRGGSYTIGELAANLILPRREVEEAVQSLRLKGEPIIGDNAGLHLSEDPAEILRYVEARRRRGVSEYLGTRALRKAARQLQERKDAESGLTLWDAA